MTFPTNSRENSSFLLSSQHPLRSSSSSKTKQPRFLYFHFPPAKLRAEPCDCKAALSCLLHKIQPQESTGRLCLKVSSKGVKADAYTFAKISFYLRFYLLYILQSCKTYLMTLSPLPLLYWNADWNLDYFR